MKLIRNILIVLFSVALIGADASEAWKRVREGIDAFRSGDFKAADEAFEKAADSQSADGRIPFNRGCAKSRLDDSAAALDFFRDAARDPVAGLSADAHYNMGCLAADQAKGVFGEDPAAADQETRVEGLKHLQTAIVHYRDARRLDTGHENARHNLEVIRLWIKQMQAVWDQRDREKERQEKNLLQFLAHLEQQQMEIRQISRVLAKEDDSPRRRTAVMHFESQQRDLAEEILPLKEKIRAELQPQQPQSPAGGVQNGAAPDPAQVEQAQKAIELLTGLADEARDAMVRSADQLESQQISASLAEQEEVLRQLNQIYMAVAPFPSLVQRAVKEQQSLNDESPAAIEKETPPADDSEDDETNDSENTVDDSAGPSYDFEEASWKQSRLAKYGEVLGPKAEYELKSVEAQLAQVIQQLDALPADEATVEEQATDPKDDGDDDSKNNDDEVTEPNTDDSNVEPSTTNPDPNNPRTPGPDGAPSPREQLQQAKEQSEQMKAALQLAIDYGPQIYDRSRAAADSLVSEDAKGAFPDQAESLRMLKEIQDALPKNDQQENQDQQQQDQNQDQQDNKDQKQNPDDKDGQKDQDKQQPEDKQPPKDKEQQSQDKQQKEKRKRDTSRDKAEAMMRKVRERERKHRELQDKIRAAVRGPGQVERDW